MSKTLTTKLADDLKFLDLRRKLAVDGKSSGRNTKALLGLYSKKYGLAIKPTIEVMQDLLKNLGVQPLSVPQYIEFIAREFFSHLNDSESEWGGNPERHWRKYLKRKPLAVSVKEHASKWCQRQEILWRS